MIAQWQRVGKTLCGQYQTVYTLKDYHSVEQETHFIFVLDASGSMSGERWQTLLQAIRSFIKTKMNASSLAHTMSCIVFNSEAQVQVPQSPLSLSNVNLLRFTSGGTSFQAALQQVTDVLNGCPDDSINVIVFMTDGNGDYPEAQLTELNSFNYLRKVDTFWGVGIAEASNSGTLKKITEAWGNKGQYRNPRELNGLITEYIEIAKLH